MIHVDQGFLLEPASCMMVLTCWRISSANRTGYHTSKHAVMFRAMLAWIRKSSASGFDLDSGNAFLSRSARCASSGQWGRAPCGHSLRPCVRPIHSGLAHEGTQTCSTANMSSVYRCVNSLSGTQCTPALSFCMQPGLHGRHLEFVGPWVVSFHPPLEAWPAWPAPRIRRPRRVTGRPSPRAD
ncbi:hypothetical protein PCS_02572 [Desulfocurvibacter africanus PCS]|uniref:Uncharacterized protein n=1 Tax=Desulfocurvibacter africanus PCS TaxID=1262666 RepID=M5PR75_DESAF|nr:hypothetical protein PCS_02572 [Desulfocurvibacter africanus PCS]